MCVSMTSKADKILCKVNHSERSGCYNNYDTVSAPPEVRWSNEGFHGSNRKKTVVV